MIYITSTQHFPRALSCEAAALLTSIRQVGLWMPDYRCLSRAQVDGLAQLIRAGYIESAAWWQYRARGGKALATVDSIDGLKAFLHALNSVAYSKMACEDRLVEKWTAKATISDFRLRPWLPTARVNEAHNQHMLDCEQALLEWRAS